jgi:uncharacterized protein YndB with AHSA1/START domain
MSEIPSAKTAMLIRKPIAEVFEAFVNPEITQRFWFTKSTGKLEAGKQLVWTWEMYHVSVPVTVKKMIKNESILIEWGNGPSLSTVEWTFKSFGDQATYVNIVNNGFQGDQAALIAQISDSTKGFTFLLAGLKAWLEHGIQLNLTADAFPSKG